MLFSPLWKRLMIWGLVALGILFAAPNLFYSRVEQHNDALKASAKAGFTTPEQEAALAAWPSYAPNGIVNLGLDLRGGAHLLAEVDKASVYKARLNDLWPEVRKKLADERAVVGGVKRAPSADGELKIQIANPDGMAKAIELVKSLATPVASLTGAGSSDIVVTGSGTTITITLSDAEKTAIDDRTMAQSLEIVRRRVDEVGTREPTIQRQGSARILIQVPGIGSAQELKELIGTTAKLTFHPVVSRTTDKATLPGLGNVLVPALDEKDVYYVLEDTPVVTGEELVDARPDFDQNGRPAVSFRFNPTGARKFGDYTANNIGQLFAIVLDNEVISAPQIQSHIPGGSGIITGSFTVEESTKLAVLLRAGALPAKMTFLEERTIGPELGQDSIDAGRKAAIIAAVAVMVFMVASYGLFGMFANIGMVINVIMILGLLSTIGATLTLPGIAGIVLTMGMAVDANVLILERMREELRDGRGPARAIDAGFEKALSAIIDANVTTMLIAIVLYFAGSGAVRGFAVTMGLGIITTVFTAVYVTKAMTFAWYNWKRPKTLEI